MEKNDVPFKVTKNRLCKTYFSGKCHKIGRLRKLGKLIYRMLFQWNNDKLTCDFDKAADTVCILQNYTETSTKTPIKGEKVF